MFQVASNEGNPEEDYKYFRDEGDFMFATKKWANAVESYTAALDAIPGDKECLVQRSTAYTQLGKIDAALADAEESLKENRNYHRGIYAKANALYFQGEFEMALVFYHRGRRVRPDLDEFRLGIQKAKESIINAVGDPKSIVLTKEGDLSYFDELGKKNLKRRLSTVQSSRAPETGPAKPSPANDKVKVKFLLQEMYGDKTFLEKLLTDPVCTSGPPAVKTLVQDTLEILKQRTEFWYQQKKVARRKREEIIMDNHYMEQQMFALDNMLEDKKPAKVIARCKKLIATMDHWNSDVVPEEMLGRLHTYMGSAYQDQKQFKKAIGHFEHDLSLGREHGIVENQVRGLLYLGRLYSANKQYTEAISVWKDVIEVEDNDEDKMSHYHELGHCYHELGNGQEALKYANSCLDIAHHLGDRQWQMNALVLVGESQIKIKDLTVALHTLTRALDTAIVLKDVPAKRAIMKRILAVQGMIGHEDFQEESMDSIVDSLRSETEQLMKQEEQDSKKSGESVSGQNSEVMKSQPSSWRKLSNLVLKKSLPSATASAAGSTPGSKRSSRTSASVTHSSKPSVTSTGQTSRTSTTRSDTNTKTAGSKDTVNDINKEDEEDEVEIKKSGVAVDQDVTESDQQDEQKESEEAGQEDEKETEEANKEEEEDKEEEANKEEEETEETGQGEEEETEEANKEEEEEHEDTSKEEPEETDETYQEEQEETEETGPGEKEETKEASQEETEATEEASQEETEATEKASQEETEATEEASQEETEATVEATEEQEDKEETAQEEQEETDEIGRGEAEEGGEENQEEQEETEEANQEETEETEEVNHEDETEEANQEAKEETKEIGRGEAAETEEVNQEEQEETEEANQEEQEETEEANQEDKEGTEEVGRGEAAETEEANKKEQEETEEGNQEEQEETDEVNQDEQEETEEANQEEKEENEEVGRGEAAETEEANQEEQEETEEGNQKEQEEMDEANQEEKEESEEVGRGEAAETEEGNQEEKEETDEVNYEEEEWEEANQEEQEETEEASQEEKEETEEIGRGEAAETEEANQEDEDYPENFEQVNPDEEPKPKQDDDASDNREGGPQSVGNEQNPEAAPIDREEEYGKEEANEESSGTSGQDVTAKSGASLDEEGGPQSVGNEQNPEAAPIDKEDDEEKEGDVNEESSVTLVLNEGGSGASVDPEVGFGQAVQMPVLPTDNDEGKEDGGDNDDGGLDNESSKTLILNATGRSADSIVDPDEKGAN